MFLFLIPENLSDYILFWKMIISEVWLILKFFQM